MPGITAVLRWLSDGKHAEFEAQYALAREMAAEMFADEIIGIADSDLDPNDKRVRVDARKWVASKLKPKRYGERIEASLSGEMGIRVIIARDGNPTPAQMDTAVLPAATVDRA